MDFVLDNPLNTYIFCGRIAASCLQQYVQCSYQHTLSQLETAALDSTHATRQLEALASSLFATDLWVAFWTIVFMRLTWESSSLLCTKACSALDVKSRLSYQCALSQLETAALDSTDRFSFSDDVVWTLRDRSIRCYHEAKTI